MLLFFSDWIVVRDVFFEVVKCWLISGYFVYFINVNDFIMVLDM